jgi:hypothetical protein
MLPIIIITLIIPNWVLTLILGVISIALGIRALYLTKKSDKQQIQARHWNDFVDAEFEIVKFDTYTPQPDTVRTINNVNYISQGIEMVQHSFNETWVTLDKITLDERLQYTPSNVRDYELVGITDIENNTIELKLRGKGQDNYRGLTVRIAQMLSCIKNHKVWVTFKYFVTLNDRLYRKQKRVMWSGEEFGSIKLDLDKLGLKVESIVSSKEEKLVGNITINFNKFCKSIPINVFTENYQRHAKALERIQRTKNNTSLLDSLTKRSMERSKDANA